MEKNRDIALFVKFVRDGEYAHVQAFTCFPDATKKFGFSGIMSFEHPLHDLEVHSQCSSGSASFYGFQLAINAINRTTLSEAQKIVRILTPIDRKLSRMYETEGNAATIGAYINRVARAIGAKCVFVEADTRHATLTGNRYHQLKLGDAVSYIDAGAAKLVAEVNPSALAA